MCFSCGVAMVCEKYENRVTAQAVLENIVKFAEQHCSFIEKPYEVGNNSTQFHTTISIAGVNKLRLIRREESQIPGEFLIRRILFWKRLSRTV